MTKNVQKNTLKIQLSGKQMKTKIDYLKINEAINFYEKKGFSYIEVPWFVSKEANDITGRGYNNFKSQYGYHVASAEQSFLEMILNKELSPGKYVACSPCFREEVEDETHSKQFMKVELIDFLGYKKPLKCENKNERYEEILNSAKDFFKKYIDFYEEDTEEGVDIVSLEGVELGSYGIRSYKNFSWVFGTGVAEPRLSYSLRNNHGYHFRDIPRGNVGEVSKIKEEIFELEDSEEQGNKIMSLTELSDLLGAIDSYLENKFSGFSIEDLNKMKNATKRAFRTGTRK